MGVARFLSALCALAVVLPVAASASAPPPGATARCRDGTYSYSRHRSGTCSHHGGVAVWLRGGGATRVAVGRTILLGPRTRTQGCRLGREPDRRCSPGAIYSRLTRAVLCARGFRTSSIRNVPQAEKFAVEHEYGLAERHYGRTLEIDHIVPLELGGSNAISNLFPERGYVPKDRLENRLHALVCAGSMSLGAAQAGIARDWAALYRRVFGVSP